MTAHTKSMLVKMSILGVGVLALVASFTATSLAAGAAENAADGGSLWDVLDPIYQAFAHGQYVYAGSLVLVAAVALARRYGGDRYPWLHSKQGSMTLVMLGSFGATLAARLAGGVELTRAIAWDATCVAVGAAGGYAALAALVVDPIVRPLVAKYAWAAPLRAVLYFFDVQAPASPALPDGGASGTAPK